MTGAFLLAWVVFPALMLVLSAGSGLAVRRLVGPGALPALLVVPVGLATLVVLAGLFCYYAPLAPLAGPACAVVGLLGLVLERGTLRRIIRRAPSARELLPVAAAAGAWAVIAAPVLLSGKPGFTGYAHIVDISYELDLAVHLAHSGRSIPASTNSAYEVVMGKYLGTGYPGGGPWTLGALSNLMPIDLSWLYQPFLAFLSAMCALSAYSLLGRLVQRRGWRALGAFIAAQPNVLVGYALGGGIKELSTVCFLLLSAAVIAQVAPRLAPGRAVVTVAIALAATIASFSLTTLPWVGVLSAGVFLTLLALQRSRVRTLLAAAEIAVLTFVLSLPTYATSVKLLPTVSGPGPLDLGNLSAPIPAITSAGVWISGDVRFPQYAHRVPSDVLDVVVLLLAAAGLIFAVRRRAWSVAWLGVAGGVSLYYVAHRYGPWIQFKADSITAPIVLLLAFAGVGALMRVTHRVIFGAVPALAIAAGVLVGNGLLYHNVTLAPYERLHNLELIGERFRHQGPTLTPDFDEYAEYYLRDDEQTSMVNGPSLGLRPGVNRELEPGGIFAPDLNEFTLSWVESFRTIIMRRSPVATRPPSNYALVYLSRYYAVWQQRRSPATVFAHVPTRETGTARVRGACAQVDAAVPEAGPGAQIAYAPAPSNYVELDGSNMTLSGAFASSGGTILATGAGRAVRRQPIPVAGRFSLFLGGSFGRPVDISIDGRRVAEAAYQVSYPSEWLLVGGVYLSRGVHTVEITRGGFSLHPGNGDSVDGFNRTVGALVMAPVGPVAPPVRYSGVAQFHQICASAQPLRWIEVIRPPRRTQAVGVRTVPHQPPGRGARPVRYRSRS